MGGTREIDTEYKQKRYDECVAHSKLCKTFGELKKKFPEDYTFYARNHFKLPWLKRTPPAIKYTEEYILSVARKFKYKKDFREREPNLYATAIRRGLVYKMPWLQTTPDLFAETNYIYRYYFKNLNAVYVGRTIQPRIRDEAHRRVDRSSAVRRFAEANGVEIPKMQILRKGLSGEDSQEMEDMYVRRYRDRGMKVLNKGATGRGKGSMGMRKQISKKKFFEIAKQYTTLAEFKEKEPQAHKAGSRNLWLRECDFLKRAFRADGTFTKKYCLVVARKCGSRAELNRLDSTVYNKMLANDWLRLCTWFSKRRELTHDFCLSIARSCKCAKDLHIKDAAVAYTMYKNDWMKECTWFESPGPSENHMRKVAQYTKAGQFVAEYKSLAEANRVTGIDRNKIGLVCMGKRHTSGGFVWKYTDGKGIIRYKSGKSN